MLFHFRNLFDKVGLLVVELLVFRPIRMESCQKIYQFLSVSQQDIRDGLRLRRIRHEHLQIVNWLTTQRSYSKKVPLSANCR